MISMIFNYY